MTSRRFLDPVSKSLLDAADYIEKHGHCKHMAKNSDGNACIVGALSITWCLSSCAKVASYLVLCVETPVVSITAWNDAPERTAEEVIAALRGAAVAQ